MQNYESQLDSIYTKNDSAYEMYTKRLMQCQTKIAKDQQTLSKMLAQIGNQGKVAFSLANSIASYYSKGKALDYAAQQQAPNFELEAFKAQKLQMYGQNLPGRRSMLKALKEQLEQFGRAKELAYDGYQRFDGRAESQHTLKDKLFQLLELREQYDNQLQKRRSALAGCRKLQSAAAGEAPKKVVFKTASLGGQHPQAAKPNILKTSKLQPQASQPSQNSGQTQWV